MDSVCNGHCDGKMHHWIIDWAVFGGPKLASETVACYFFPFVYLIY
jgi:hypothetical protein